MKYITDIWDEIVTWCHSGVEVINYGALYNWYAATDVRNITSAGWHIPTRDECLTLLSILDPDGLPKSNTAGGLMKQIGTTHWTSPNTDATNSSGFNGRGSGFRPSNFQQLTTGFAMWALEGASTTAVALSYNHGIFYINNSGFYNSYKYYGLSIRPIKDSTTLTHGQTGTYTGNDGKVYQTICIGTQELVADNLTETKYRDGTDIPIVTDNTAWAALVTGAMCYYNNNINNA